MTSSHRTSCRTCIAAVVRVRGDGGHPVSAGCTCEKGRAIGAIEHHLRRPSEEHD